MIVLETVTVFVPLSMPPLLMLTVMSPAETLVTASDLVVPLPVNVPLVAEPVPLVIVISPEDKPVTVSLKVKVIAVV